MRPHAGLGIVSFLKTLFITVYDGAISKNILRTDIFRLLKEQYRIVLFVPEKKYGYYVEQFQSTNVHIEVTPPPDRPLFEAKFQSLALDLYHTESVRIKIMHRYAVHGNVFKMLSKLLLWHVGRFQVVHRMLRAAYARVTDRSLELFFDKYQPHAVFVPNMMSNEDYRMIKSARRRGIITIGMPKSWDNLTTKTFFNTFPDWILMQNEPMEKTAMRLFRYPRKHIEIVGHPPFDIYAHHRPSISREEFCLMLGLDPSRKIILYGAAGHALAPYDEEVLDILIRAVASDPRLQNTQILVRPHPKYEFDESKITHAPYVVIDAPGHTVTERKATWEFLDTDIEHLMDSLMHMDVLVSTASTLNLEGAIFDKPLVSIAFDGQKTMPFALSTARYYRYEHLQPLVASGGMPVAYSADELITYVSEALEKPDKYTDGRKKIVSTVVWKADGQSGKRVADAIMRLMS